MRTCRYCGADIYREKQGDGRSVWVDAKEGGTYDLCEENWDLDEMGPHRISLEV